MAHLIKIFVTAVTLLTFMNGCAAIQHRNLETKVQMQQSIFVDPDTLGDKPIYIRVTNQTGKSNLNFDNIVGQKLIAKGFKITKNSKAAGLRIFANFLYLDKQSKDMSAEAVMVGGFGGAITGIGAGSGNYRYNDGQNAYETNTTGGVIGALGGAAIGSLISVDKVIGVVDIQVEQPLQHAAVKYTRAASRQAETAYSGQHHQSSIGYNGSASAEASGELSEMSYNEKVTRKQNKTRMVAEAVQTNIDERAAFEQIKEQLADAIAGFI